jgi:predicted phosphohydrolase
VTVASRRTTAALAELRPDALLLAGDISYANGYQPRWDDWANQAEPLTSVVPLLPAPGNHEAKDYYGATYRTRFATPGQGRNWYTTDVGRASLFVGTAGCFLTPRDPASARDLVLDELVGLERSLAVAAARRAAGEIDFLVVAQHFPLYTNHETRGPFSPELVVAQEHVLQRYQVDLVLVGHDHMYQRSLPMAYGEPTGSALGYVQVVAGAGGNGLYDFADPAGPDWGDWCAAWSRRFSFTEYTVEPGRLTAQAHSWDDPQAREPDVDPNAVDPELRAEPLDSFVLQRKDAAVVAAAALAPRPPAEVVAGVPEVAGVVVRNDAEDCTRHH